MVFPFWESKVVSEQMYYEGYFIRERERLQLHHGGRGKMTLWKTSTCVSADGASSMTCLNLVQLIWRGCSLIYHKSAVQTYREVLLFKWMQQAAPIWSLGFVQECSPHHIILSLLLNDLIKTPHLNDVSDGPLNHSFMNQFIPQSAWTHIKTMMAVLFYHLKDDFMILLLCKFLMLNVTCHRGYLVMPDDKRRSGMDNLKAACAH